MVREIVISLYLFVFKSLFSLFKRFPLKDKTTFVISFGDNSKYVFEEMCRQQIPSDVVFLCSRKSWKVFRDYEYVTRLPFEPFHFISWVKGIYHLATSRHILVDNYYGFLAVTDFKSGVECIQLWHASGAIKKFGLEDNTVKDRSDQAKQRFLNVYNKFDKIVVGSDIMENIFLKAFNLKQDKILKFGIPRTDFFFDEHEKSKVKNKLIQENPLLKEKKVILYAPTYRDHELDHFQLQLDLQKMKQELGEAFILLLRLHPAIKKTADDWADYPDFVFDYSSSRYDINELLIVADYLITDYSSIPYEFSLLRKPMLFFTYDLDAYKQNRGLWDEVNGRFPGPIAMDTRTIIELLEKNQFDLNIVDSYAKKWNKYSTGRSSQNLVTYMFKARSPQLQEQTAL